MFSDSIKRYHKKWKLPENGFHAQAYDLGVLAVGRRTLPDHGKARSDLRLNAFGASKMPFPIILSSYSYMVVFD